LRVVLQAGDLVAQGDIFFGQRLEAPVIFHVLFHLGGLLWGDALGELLAVKEALQDVIRTLPGGRSGGLSLEELFAQGAAAEAVDGVHLRQESLPFSKKVIQIRFHGHIVSL
jgi:hypothetical protein